MNTQNPKKWYTRNKFLIPVTAIITLLLTIFLAPQVNKWFADKKEDFKMSLNTTQENVKQGEIVKIHLTLQPDEKYDKSISLSAIGQSSDIEIIFNPQNGKIKEDMTSEIEIRPMASVTPGERDITIKGIGSDGKFHECFFKLNITGKKIENPPQPPSGDTDPINGINKISYGDKVYGYLKIPDDVSEFTLYLMEGDSPKVGSTEIMQDEKGDELNQISRDQFLNNLGKYIKMANDKNKKLILSANDKQDKWRAANKFKFGKEANNLKQLKQIKMWHPNDNVTYNMTGWINY
jgi:hypothetical protein